MARTIQKKNNFNHGMTTKELVERTDLDIFNKSAEKLLNMTPIIYGGLRSRRGTEYVSKLSFIAPTQATGTVTSPLGNASSIQTAGANFVSNAIGSTKELFRIDYGSVQTVGHFTIYGLRLRYATPSATAYWESHAQNSVRVSSVSLNSGGVGFEGTATVAPKGRTSNPAALAMTINDKGVVTALTVSNAGSYGPSTNTAATSVIFTRTGSARSAAATLYASADGANWSKVSSITITESATNFTFDINAAYQYIKLQLDSTETIKTDFTLNYVHMDISSDAPEATPDNVKLLPFVYNLDAAYLIGLANKNIMIFKDGALEQIIVASIFTDEIIKNLTYAYKDDTIIFTHPDIQPMRLLRMDTGWNFGAFPLKNIPRSSFNGEKSTTKTTEITPSATEGSVIITGSGFTADMVGQYIDGGGGRAKIVDFISATQIRVRTVIPFYTTDKITSWEYISGYEEVWSNTRGWPRTCLFVEQRLCFGGSHDMPNMLWFSRVGDYNNFENIGNYDNDAIEWPLLSNSGIVSMAIQRNMHIFTSAEHFVVPEGRFTPSKFTTSEMNKNGCFRAIRPTVYENGVLTIERKGRNLYYYGYDDSAGGFAPRNASLYFQYEGVPVDMALEKNSVKDKGDFLYVLVDSGVMYVQALGLSENINAPCIFETDGKILSVATVADDTYIAVVRNGDIMIEKIADVRTDSTRYTQCVNGTITDLTDFIGERVYVEQNGRAVAKNVDDTGQIKIGFADGAVKVGLPFRYEVKSNPIAINGRTTSIRKRINRATVECVDTPKIQLNEQILEGEDTYDFFAVGEYERDCRYVIAGEYTPVRILSVQLDVSYEG